MPSNLAVGTVRVTTANKIITLQIRALPIPKNIVTFLEENVENIRKFSLEIESKSRKSTSKPHDFIADSFWEELNTHLGIATKEGSIIDSDLWANIRERYLISILTIFIINVSTYFDL